MSATVIGAHARVLGSIEVGEVGDVGIGGAGPPGGHGADLIVEGRIEGSVRATGVIHLLATAEVLGDLEAARVVIDDGALFEGQVRLRRDRPAERPAAPVVAYPVTPPAISRPVPDLATPGRRRLQRRGP